MIVESLAIGVPVVAIAVSAIPEIILHEKTGLLVPPKRPEAMADAIQRILKDKTLKEKATQNGEKWSCGNSIIGNGLLT